MPAIYSMIGHSASLNGSNVWHYIRWDKVKRHVKSLQVRIVKAVRAKRWNLVKVLQGILRRSYAARLLAIRRVTENSGKRTAGIDFLMKKEGETSLNSNQILVKQIKLAV